MAFAPYLVNKMGKKWHVVYLDYAWGQSTRDAYVNEIKKNGGDVTGTTGIPLGTADMTAFISKISLSALSSVGEASPRRSSHGSRQLPPVLSRPAPRYPPRWLSDWRPST